VTLWQDAQYTILFPEFQKFQLPAFINDPAWMIGCHPCRISNSDKFNFFLSGEK